MAIYYVWSGAAGSANGTSWANAYLKINTALTGKVADDFLYVAHDHSETTAGTVLFITPNSNTNPLKIVCVNRAGSVPPVAADRRATAVVASSGDSNFQISNAVIMDGIIVVAGNGSGAPTIALQAGAGSWTRLENCSLRIGSTGAGKIAMSTAATYIEMVNTTCSFSGTGQGINLFGSILRWRDTPSALIGTAVPNSIMTTGTSTGGDIELIGVDLSAAGSGKTIITATSAAATKIKLVDCKIDAAATKATVPPSPGACEFDFVRTAPSGNYAVYRHRYSGVLTEETTIVRTGGATDGTTPISWKVVTTANSSFGLPFDCPPIAIWNDTTGSAKTATIECVWGGGAVPNDDEIWVEVQYLGDASPRGFFVSDAKATLLTTAAGQASSSATWGGSTTKFKLNVTFTAQQEGWIYARVKCAKVSSTFYIDPLVTLT